MLFLVRLAHIEPQGSSLLAFLHKDFDAQDRRRARKPTQCLPRLQFEVLDRHIVPALSLVFYRLNPIALAS